MWVRLQLDIGWWDVAFGLSRLARRSAGDDPARRVEARFALDGRAIACLAVRSGLDLLYGTVGWPAGSEVLYSALNIPDMSMVARENGLVPVPVDLDLKSLAPDLDKLEAAITPRTKAVLIAHLYGAFVEMGPLIRLARRHGLMVIEDCAENYDGRYTGHPDSDVALFSFGPLKTAAALAGGVMVARDPELAARLRAAHDAWPAQGRLDYFNRLCKYGTLKLFGSRSLYADARAAVRLALGDVDKFISHSAKSFRASEIMHRLRQRPSAALLAVMDRRLSRFDHARVAQRTANGRLLADRLRDHVLCPGADVDEHNYWLFPAMVSDPPATMRALEAAGFDTTLIDSMRAVEPPADRPELDPVNVRRMLRHAILLPCYAGIPESELHRMADVVIRCEMDPGLTTEAQRPQRQHREASVRK